MGTNNQSLDVLIDSGTTGTENGLVNGNGIGNGDGNGNGLGSENGHGSETTDKQPLIDTVLCFIMHGLDTGTPANVHKVALSTFTVMEVRLAVRNLWAHCHLGKVPVKHGS